VGEDGDNAVRQVRVVFADEEIEKCKRGIPAVGSGGRERRALREKVVQAIEGLEKRGNVWMRAESDIDE
jgi:hypothetical protein